MASGRDYAALRDHLSADGGAVITRTFAQLDAVVGGAGLPPSARDYDRWWRNEGVNTTRHRHCLSWQQAGYDVDKVDRRAETVTFRRRA